MIGTVDVGMIGWALIRAGLGLWLWHYFMRRHDRAALIRLRILRR